MWLKITCTSAIAALISCLEWIGYHSLLKGVFASRQEDAKEVPRADMIDNVPSGASLQKSTLRLSMEEVEVPRLVRCVRTLRMAIDEYYGIDELTCIQDRFRARMYTGFLVFSAAMVLVGCVLVWMGA